MKTFERRYHATWATVRVRSPLALLAEWMCAHPGQLAAAPPKLLISAKADVTARLSAVAVREPTRRHKKHFGWLLGWYTAITTVIGRGVA